MTDPALSPGLDWRAVAAGFAIAAVLSALVGGLIGSAGGFGGFIGLTLAIFAAAGFVATKLARRPGPGHAVAAAVAYIVVAAVLQSVADLQSLTTVDPTAVAGLDTLGLMVEDLVRLVGAVLGARLAGRV